MTTSTYNVHPGTIASSAPIETTLHGHAASGNATGPTVLVPESQLYYWTRAWQRNERISVEELARGEGIRFRSGREAADWLLVDDDEQPAED